MENAMKSWFKVKVVVMGMLCVMLLSPAGLSAAGNANIGGYAANGSITWYYSERYVTNPTAAGPEVAFYQLSESTPLFLYLGTHDCNRNGAGPMYRQYIGHWRPVHYYEFTTKFCLWTYSSSGSGSFNGNLAWD